MPEPPATITHRSVGQPNSELAERAAQPQPVPDAQPPSSVEENRPPGITLITKSTEPAFGR